MKRAASSRLSKRLSGAYPPPPPRTPRVPGSTVSPSFRSSNLELQIIEMNTCSILPVPVICQIAAFVPASVNRMSSSSSSSVAKKKKKPRKVRLPHHLHPNKNSIEIINLCESDSDNDNARTPPTSLQQRVAAALLPSAPPPDSVLNTLLQDLASHNETAGKSTKHTGNCAERLCENGGEKGRRDGGGSWRKRYLHG